MTRDIRIIVPMRGIERSKSRLAAAIDGASRARLNRWLLMHTLNVIGRWRGELSSCVLVSPCKQALELAQRAGAAVLREPDDANDLNRAVTLGVSQATADGAGRILVLPCDLPDLTPDSLRMLLSVAGHAECMVLAADNAGTGTNALLMRAQHGIEFRFGDCSLARHREEAIARGWPVAVVTRPDLGFDIDTPDDLAVWMKHGAQYPRALRLKLTGSSLCSSLGRSAMR